MTARVKPEIATAVKRASLARQLNGQEPCHVQDITEVAVEAWLREEWLPIGYEQSTIVGEFSNSV